MSNLSAVLAPFDLGKFKLKNRIVMAPMTRCRASRAGVPPTYAAENYAQRAGAGLIITEATNISPQAVGYAFTPGIWSSQQVAAWQHVTRTVHANDGLIFLQLWHTGRVSHPDLQPEGALPVAPSAVRLDEMAFTYEGPKPHPTPRALEQTEIAEVVNDFRTAASRALDAGFDGVEIHSGNNYLLEQFVRDSTNKRTDDYGGSIENRLRFPMQVVDAVCGVWGKDRVGIRLSPATTWPGNTPLDSEVDATFGAYIDRLSDAGLLYIHLIEGVTQGARDTSGGPDFGALRKRFSGAYIGNNGLTLALAEQRLAQGQSDLFAFARAFIANPDLIERWKTGAPLADSPAEYRFDGDHNGYSNWPGMTGQAVLAPG